MGCLSTALFVVDTRDESNVGAWRGRTHTSDDVCGDGDDVHPGCGGVTQPAVSVGYGRIDTVQLVAATSFPPHERPAVDIVTTTFPPILTIACAAVLGRLSE